MARGKSSLAYQSAERASRLKHSHPEFSGKTLQLEGYWHDGESLPRTPPAHSARKHACGGTPRARLWRYAPLC